MLCILDITATDTIKKNRNGYMGINEEKFCEAHSYTHRHTHRHTDVLTHRCAHTQTQITAPSGVAIPKLMVGPDYRGTKEVLENLTLAAPG